MQYTLILAGLAASVLASPSNKRQDACASKCYAAYNTCRGQPDANRAFCASQYASCLGYSPFGADGSLVTPTACSITTGFSNATATVGPPVYTTEIVTALTTYCPAPTTVVVNSKTYTVTSATTLTITDCPCTVTKAPTPSKTYSPCDQVYNSCIAAGNGSPNIAACAASSASCAGTASATPPPATTATATTGAVASTTKPVVVVTAAAGAVKPVMGLVALGAMALI